MRVKSIVIDDFYKTPGDVRNFALSQEYSIDVNTGLLSSQPFLTGSIQDSISDVMLPVCGEITGWGNKKSGSFGILTSLDPIKTHFDTTSDWTAVIFLTPNAPSDSGISILKHRETGLRKYGDPVLSDDDPVVSIVNKSLPDVTKWEIVDSFANIYNRMVIYRSEYFSRVTNNFGLCRESGRLCQTFSFSTSNPK
jgi:hypothetical protein